MNATAEKFGYPDSLLAQFDHWLVLLRPAQVTLGSLVLLCTDAASRFGEISTEASTELVAVTSRIEGALSAAFQNDKINYLMLMMVDPDVHFHVIPRYDGTRTFQGASYGDAAWPGPPDVTSRMEMDEAALASLGAELKRRLAS